MINKIAMCTTEVLNVLTIKDKVDKSDLINVMYKLYAGIDDLLAENVEYYDGRVANTLITIGCRDANIFTNLCVSKFWLDFEKFIDNEDLSILDNMMEEVNRFKTIAMSSIEASILDCTEEKLIYLGFVDTKGLYLIPNYIYQLGMLPNIKIENMEDGSEMEYSTDEVFNPKSYRGNLNYGIRMYIATDMKPSELRDIQSENSRLMYDTVIDEIPLDNLVKVAIACLTCHASCNKTEITVGERDEDTLTLSKGFYIDIKDKLITTFEINEFRAEDKENHVLISFK